MRTDHDFGLVVILLVIIIISMILHELAHGVVALWLGDRTAKDAGRLTLNPLKHLDPVMSIIVPMVLYFTGGPIFGGAKPVPINTRNLKGGVWGMALVAIAGPAMNFILALVGFLIGHFSGLAYASPMGWFIFSEIIFANLGFFLFNIIPIPPLDGSRVLYAIAPDGVRDFMAKVERFGIVIIYILLLVFSTAFSQYISGATTGIVELFYKLVGA